MISLKRFKTRWCKQLAKANKKSQRSLALRVATNANTDKALNYISLNFIDFALRTVTVNSHSQSVCVCVLSFPVNWLSLCSTHHSFYDFCWEIWHICYCSIYVCVSEFFFYASPKEISFSTKSTIYKLLIMRAAPAKVVWESTLKLPWKSIILEFF